MCTAIAYKTKDFYFGRNLDLEYSYNEVVTITPRNYPFKFSYGEDLLSHFAMIGMAYVVDDYPLYYEAVNEKGLCMAGLSFEGNAVYNKPIAGKMNVATYEFIPWILSQCESVTEVKNLLENLNITNLQFNCELPATDLHWIIADSESCIVVEQVASGLKIYDNPVGVLTNNPPFKYHLQNLNNYMMLSPNPPVNNFSDSLNFKTYSRGMGAIGLPGDLSSMSRFVRAAFVRFNSVSGESEEESVSQFFHILGAVEQQRGCVRLGDKNEITVYSSCCNADKGVYYYRTYDNSRICAVRLFDEKLDTEELFVFTLEDKGQFLYQN